MRRSRTRHELRERLRFGGGPPELSGSAGVDLRWYHRFELEHLLARAGFTDSTFFGSFDRTPWKAGGETIALARAEG